MPASIRPLPSTRKCVRSPRFFEVANFALICEPARSRRARTHWIDKCQRPSTSPPRAQKSHLRTANCTFPTTRSSPTSRVTASVPICGLRPIQYLMAQLNIPTGVREKSRGWRSLWERRPTINSGSTCRRCRSMRLRSTRFPSRVH